MADQDDIQKNSAQTLLTLARLRQTREGMTSVVDRLQNHLTRQVSLDAQLSQDQE